MPIHKSRKTQQLDDIEDAPEIVGERGQAELGANLLQPAHQKRSTKRVFDRLAALIEDVGAVRYAPPSLDYRDR